MTQRMESGVTDQFVYFDAPPGLGTWVVFGSLDGAAAAAFTTPTVNETDSTNMPGAYELLLDEQTTLTGGNSTEVLKLYISAAGWAGKSIEVEIFADSSGTLLTDWLEGGRLDNILDARMAEASIDTTGGAVDSVTLADTVTNLTNLPSIPANWLTAAGIAIDAGAKIRGSITGTSDSGSTTTMVDNARTEADGYWKGAAIRFTSGNIDGQTRIITGFVASSDTITFSPPTTSAVTTQTYEIVELIVDPWTRILGNTTYSASAIMQIAAGTSGGKMSGLATGTVTMRDLEDAANMVVGTVDADGNRSAITIIAPAD